MQTIEQDYTIHAPVTEVWKALTDGPTAELWGAAPAKADAREGGEFSYWDGDIHGTYTKLVPGERIEQDWYGHDHPERKFTAMFTFTAQGDVTKVHLTFSGEIDDPAKDIKDWQEYYFDPIKHLLEQQV